MEMRQPVGDVRKTRRRRNCELHDLNRRLSMTVLVLPYGRMAGLIKWPYHASGRAEVF